MSQFIKNYFFIDSTTPDANRPKLINFLDQVILLGRFAAVLPLDNPGFKSKLYYAWMAMTSIVISLTGWQCIICLILRFDGDLNKVMDILINIPSYFCGSIFFLYYQKRNGFLKKMFKFAYDNFRFRSARGLTILTIRPAVRFNKAFIPIFGIFTVSGPLQGVFTAMLLSTMKGQRQLPVELDYPFDSHATPYFELLFALQVYMQTIVAIHFVNMSCVFVVFSILTSAQFDILRCSIKNTGYTALLRLGVRHSALSRIDGFTSSTDAYCCGSEEEIDCCYDQIAKNEVQVNFGDQKQVYKADIHDVEGPIETMGTYQDLNKNEIEDKVMEAIKDCVEHHLVIRTFCGYMEDYFTPAFAFNLSGLCLFACFTLYSLTDHFTFKTLIYLSVGISMTLIICYMGNQIRLQSERLDLAVYWSGWEEQSIRVRKHYHILMHQAMRPVILTGGGLMQLTLDNFMVLMKAAFSFYTLMRNTSQNKYKTDL